MKARRGFLWHTGNMPQDLDAGFLRQRRNLLMISIALLLYELAEGKLKGASLMAPVEFGKPWVALVFGWVAFFYLWWRYVIRSRGYRKKVKDDWIVSVQEDRRYRNLVSDIVSANLQTIPKGHHGNLRPRIKSTWRSRKFDYSQHLGRGGDSGEDARAIAPAPYWKVVAVECRGILSAIFRHTTISDYVLPQVIAGATLIVGIGLNVNSIFRWLGGILGSS